MLIELTTGLCVCVCVCVQVCMDSNKTPCLHGLSLTRNMLFSFFCLSNPHNDLLD